MRMKMDWRRRRSKLVSGGAKCSNVGPDKVADALGKVLYVQKD